MGVIPPWSDLPQELLSTISHLLSSNPLHLLTFRSVCKSWHSSSSSSSSSLVPSTLFPPLPLAIAPVPYILRDRFSPRSHYHILSTTAIYSIRPPPNHRVDFCSATVPKAWVLLVDQSLPGAVTIRKPFTRLSYSLPLNFPRNLDLLSFRGLELGRFCTISCCSNTDGRLRRLSVLSGVVRKTVLFESDCGVSVVALSEEGKLGLLRLGLGDNFEELGKRAKWEVVHDGKRFRFDDIVEFKGRMLGIDRRGRVYRVELCFSSSSSPAVMNSVVPSIAGGGGRRKRLLESLGRLYLVVRSNVRGPSDPLFKVYELNEGANKWVEVKSLGGRTFFFGLEFSFSASAEELHGLYGKNYVVFNEKSFLNYSGYDDDSRLFDNLTSGELKIGVWKLEDAANLDVIGSLPDYSCLLWPPPVWIWQINLSERIGLLLSVLDHLQMKVPDYEKLEAKLDELSVRQQNCALTIIKPGIMLKSSLGQAKKVNMKLKQLKMFPLSLLQPSKSSDVLIQGGAFTHEAEEQRDDSSGEFKLLQNIMRDKKLDVDLLSLEFTLHTVVLTIEEIASEIEGLVNSHKFSASMDELTEVLNST